MVTSHHSPNFTSYEASPEQLKSEEDQLIVANPYTDLVIQTLKKLNTGVTLAAPPESSEELGLSLLRLEGPLTAEFLERIKRWFPELSDLVPEDKVGVLISSIKAAIGWYSGDWSPTVGRNRLVGHLTATDGRVNSDEDPEPVDGKPPFPPLESDLQSVGGGLGRGAIVGIADTALWPHAWFQSADIFQDGPYDHPAPLGERDEENPFRTAHSTFVTGLVLAQAPAAKIRVAGVLNADGIGNSWQVANEIVRLGKTGINILNLSFSCYSGDAEPPLALAAAIDRLDPEIVVVAGAGNYGAKVDFVESFPGGRLVNLSIAPAWPAALDDVVAVGSTAGRTAKRADFSPNAAWVDILAPGEPVISTFVDGLFDRAPAADPSSGAVRSTSFARWSGTSFSTAIVTGAIAAGMSTGRTARESWREIRDHGLRPATGLTHVLGLDRVRPFVLANR